jgi:hypothetical protein
LPSKVETPLAEDCRTLWILTIECRTDDATLAELGRLTENTEDRPDVAPAGEGLREAMDELVLGAPPLSLGAKLELAEKGLLGPKEEPKDGLVAIELPLPMDALLPMLASIDEMPFVEPGTSGGDLCEFEEPARSDPPTGQE